jgi:hypothetical protein
MASNTQRSLKYVRDMGCAAQVVEKWNPYSKHRVDLFGVIDIVAIGAIGIIGLQSCSDSGRSEHRKKLLESPLARQWVSAGGRLWLVTWGKHPNPKRVMWAPHVEVLTLLEFDKYKAENPSEGQLLRSDV